MHMEEDQFANDAHIDLQVVPSQAPDNVGVALVVEGPAAGHVAPAGCHLATSGLK